MIAPILASAVLAAMPAATGDVTTTSSLRQWEDDSAVGAITARRTAPAPRRPARIVTKPPRQVLASWRCNLTHSSLHCRSTRTVKANGSRYRIRASYVAFTRNHTTRTRVTVNPLDW